MNAPRSAPPRLDRAVGALTGLAVGDALGMPTQSLSRAEIAETYGPITDLVEATGDQPIAPNMPAGSITDDTEQALLVADLLIAGQGHIDAALFAQALVDWERQMVARGSLDLLGPSTKSALSAIHAGADPYDAGRTGTTNGAAMRIAPVGIAVPATPDALIPAVLEASCLTHNTSLGLSAAGAVAAAVSTGLDGADATGATSAAITVAQHLSTLGTWVAGGSIAARIHWACEAIAGTHESTALDFVADVIGTSMSSQESVVAAFALAHRFDHEPFAALCHAATLGGDTDTIAAIAGAILGARHGMAVWPPDAVARVTTVNDLALTDVAHQLLALRDAAPDRCEEV